jgi:hypothetical protein
LSGRRSAEARLVVDLQTAQGGFFGDRGIRRYAMSFTLAVLRKRAVSAVLLNPNRPNHESMPTELRDAPEAAWNTVSTLRRLDAEGVGAYVMTSPFERTRPASHDDASDAYLDEGVGDRTTDARSATRDDRDPPAVRRHEASTTQNLLPSGSARMT